MRVEDFLETVKLDSTVGVLLADGSRMWSGAARMFPWGALDADVLQVDAKGCDEFEVTLDMGASAW